MHINIAVTVHITSRRFPAFGPNYFQTISKLIIVVTVILELWSAKTWC
jgi:hypothetical protein